ncbi:MAG TPA: Fur family transcriptional regulator [Thermodesulfobacteriota bacterium]|nr:Fur family transcriptional regulator [Thermodesulfobacteriota bacterium]
MKKDPTVIKLGQIGLKVTPQRQGILKVLSGNRTHPSAESVYHEMVKDYPRISFATVYNTLSRLAEAGEIQELDIDPSKKRFDPSRVPHGHFYCKVCGEVFDVLYDSPLLTNLKTLSAKNREGHEVDLVQIELKGVCKECKRKQQGNRRGFSCVKGGRDGGGREG